MYNNTVDMIVRMLVQYLTGCQGFMAWVGSEEWRVAGDGVGCLGCLAKKIKEIQNIKTLL